MPPSSSVSFPPGMFSASFCVAILRQRTSQVELKQYAVQLMEEAGSLAYTREKLLSLREQCRSLIAGLGGNAQLTSILDSLSKAFSDSPTTQ